MVLRGTSPKGLASYTYPKRNRAIPFYKKRRRRLMATRPSIRRGWHPTNVEGSTVDGRRDTYRCRRNVKAGFLVTCAGNRGVDCDESEEQVEDP